MTQISTLYPGSNDSFSVPSSPSTTPLSSAGSSTRNHVSSHRDMGDAIVALQANATQSTHGHSGVGIDGIKLAQANTHQSPDTDSGPTALHHSIGTGAFQAASGSHTHDTRYIRLDGNVAQTVTGKKTFPTGTDAINILSFQNSSHSHLDIANGGPAYPSSGIVSGVHGGVGNGSPVYGTTTEDMYLFFNRITIPAGVALVGNVNIHYYIDINSGVAGQQLAPDIFHGAFFYLSHNEGESPAFSSSKNILQNGGFFNGLMCQSAHAFNNSGLAEGKRMNLSLPIYLAPSGSARTNFVIVMRVVNTANGWMKELNWGLRFHLVSQNFIAL